MTAKNTAANITDKNAFLAELRQKLSVLSESEAITALAYYDEYLSEAGPENEAAAIAELGSPAHVAAGILGDQIYAETTGEEKSTKKGLGALWLVVIGLLASPIALPLAIVLIAVIFSLLISAFSMILSLFVAAIVLMVAGIVYIGAGFGTLFTSFATGLVTVGYGLVAIASGSAMMIGLVWLTKITVNALAKLGAKMLQRNKTRKEVRDAY
jgi:uncharacterized membrane protein